MQIKNTFASKKSKGFAGLAAAAMVAGPIMLAPSATASDEDKGWADAWAGSVNLFVDNDELPADIGNYRSALEVYDLYINETPTAVGQVISASEVNKSWTGVNSELRLDLRSAQTERQADYLKSEAKTEGLELDAFSFTDLVTVDDATATATCFANGDIVLDTDVNGLKINGVDIDTDATELQFVDIPVNIPSLTDANIRAEYNVLETEFVGDNYGAASAGVSFYLEGTQSDGTEVFNGLGSTNLALSYCGTPGASS